MRKIQVRAGHVGYRNQFDRARRFLDRIESTQSNDVEFQDMVWAFFQNCHHMRDWVNNDPLISREKKSAVLKKAGNSLALRRSADLCNGTKHLAPKPTRHSHVDMCIQPGSGRPSEMDCMIDVGASELISAKQLARDCIAEWEQILKSEQLATDPMN
jgi:hypothetical protein